MAARQSTFCISHKYRGCCKFRSTRYNQTKVFWKATSLTCEIEKKVAVDGRAEHTINGTNQEKARGPPTVFPACTIEAAVGFKSYSFRALSSSML